jgi:hemerythrin superfamily protein
MKKRNARLLLIGGLLLLLMAGGILLWLSTENTQYYAYRDLAMASCESGDMKRSIEYIQISIQHAKDPDLISEGRHYQWLFEHNLCEE